MRGVHENVGELDFTSLYPTLMLRKNLGGETVNCRCCPNSSLRVPELGYNICLQRTGIVPSSLEILLKRRAAYKKLKNETKDPDERARYDQRQAALKWILVCSFGYLGFKNARFGNIDAHIATCAFSRDALQRAVGIAQSDGFSLLHGIVDSMWLYKSGAGDSDYQRLARKISNELDLPLEFEGRYKWIVFCKSRVDPQAYVANRYFGVFQDGTIKVRGIELRRHDTPEIVNKCQTEMLDILSKAEDSKEFVALIPEALRVLKSYASMLRTGTADMRDLLIEKSLSKEPYEYTNTVAQAVAAQRLTKEGGTVHAGHRIRYVLTCDKSRTSGYSAVPAELVDENTTYHPEMYIDLLVTSAINLFLPLGCDAKSLREWIYA